VASSIRIVTASVVYIFAVLAGSLLLIIPGFIIFTMFVFYICYIIDKRCRVFEAFSMSKGLTDGRKIQIFTVILGFNLIMMLPFSVAIMSGATGLVINFIISFFATIIGIMQQRLTAVMYMDLEYGTDGSR
jgi:hypothetical protein